MRTLDQLATDRYEQGAAAADHADTYVFTTLILATVLFLLGISRHFPMRSARYGLITVAIVVLTIAGALLATAPKPPA